MIEKVIKYLLNFAVEHYYNIEYKGADLKNEKVSKIVIDIDNKSITVR